MPSGSCKQDAGLRVHHQTAARCPLHCFKIRVPSHPRSRREGIRNEAVHHIRPPTSARMTRPHAQHQQAAIPRTIKYERHYVAAPPRLHSRGTHLTAVSRCRRAQPYQQKRTTLVTVGYSPMLINIELGRAASGRRKGRRSPTIAHTYTHGISLGRPTETTTRPVKCRDSAVILSDLDADHAHVSVEEVDDVSLDMLLETFSRTSSIISARTSISRNSLSSGTVYANTDVKALKKPAPAVTSMRKTSMRVVAEQRTKKCNDAGG